MGAGANARHSIGTGIIGGMIGETTLAMLYVPLLFYLFDRMAEGKDADKADAEAPAPSPAPEPATPAAAPAAAGGGGGDKPPQAPREGE
jgi:multidrug efflux pump